MVEVLFWFLLCGVFHCQETHFIWEKKPKAVRQHTAETKGECRKLHFCIQLMQLQCNDERKI